VAKLKVFGGCFDGKNRVICAAPSQKACVENLKAAGVNVSLHYFREHACDTGNEEELEIALANPGEVYSSPDMGNHNYKHLPRRT
jgi:hypothetical protein